MYIWSAKNLSFFPSTDRDIYIKSGWDLSDGVKVNDRVFIKFSGIPPEGKQRGIDDKGYPAWVDVPPLTHEQLVARADAEKQRRIDQANEYMNSKQWPGKAAIGRLQGDDLAQYNLWLDYLDALEAIDTSVAPDVAWPPKPE